MGKLLSELNAHRVPMGVPDVLPALAAGRIDAAYSSPLAAIALQWNARVKHELDASLGYSIGASVFVGRKWDAMDEADRQIVMRVMDREAERLSLPPVARPKPFPQNSLIAARIALIGLAAGWGVEFCRRVFVAEFADGKSIEDPAELGRLLEGLGVPPEPVLQQAGSDPIKAQLRAATERAVQIGVFGAPTFVCGDGELFWGNDRLDAALDHAERLNAAGTAK